MKKTLILAVVMLFAATSAFALVAGTPHDLATGLDASGGAYSGATLSACQYCHTPHNSNTAAAGGGAPIWNRTVEADGVFTPYGTTVSGTSITAPGPNSKACLSCHDGNIGVGTTFDGTTDTIASTNLTAGAITPGLATNVGVDLTNDHPVGFLPVNGNAGVTYNAGTETITGQNGAPDFPLFGSTGTKQMECGTCHNPHDDSTNAKFLRRPLGSICTDCHVY